MHMKLLIEFIIESVKFLLCTMSNDEVLQLD